MSSGSFWVRHHWWWCHCRWMSTQQAPSKRTPHLQAGTRKLRFNYWCGNFQHSLEAITVACKVVVKYLKQCGHLTSVVAGVFPFTLKLYSQPLIQPPSAITDENRQEDKNDQPDREDRTGPDHQKAGKQSERRMTAKQNQRHWIKLHQQLGKLLAISRWKIKMPTCRWRDFRPGGFVLSQGKILQGLSSCSIFGMAFWFWRWRCGHENDQATPSISFGK